MNYDLPLGGVATITTSSTGAITVATPVGGGPPSGITTVTIDPNVTKAAVANTIAMLAAVLIQMP